MVELEKLTEIPNHQQRAKIFKGYVEGLDRTREYYPLVFLSWTDEEGRAALDSVNKNARERGIKEGKELFEAAIDRGDILSAFQGSVHVAILGAKKSLVNRAQEELSQAAKLLNGKAIERDSLREMLVTEYIFGETTQTERE